MFKRKIVFRVSSFNKKQYVATILIISILMQMAACSVKEKAEDVAYGAMDAASGAKQTVVEWYENLDFDKFKTGWEYAVDFLGTQYAAKLSSDYVTSVADKITELKVNINSVAGTARDKAQEAGFVAEKWTAGTFNINAAANESSYSATTPNSNELGSADVTTNYGENASLKYYKSASASASAQAKTLIQKYREYCRSAGNDSSKPPMSLKEYMDKHGYSPEDQDALLSSVYEGQTRIIPPEQLQEAVDYLNGRIDKLSAIEGKTASERTSSYQETLDRLKDRLQAPDGTESMPLSKEDAQAIAELSETGDFKPEDFNITLSKVIEPKYVLKQAVGTGVEAGLLKAAFTVGPDVFSVVIEALKEGDIDEAKLQEIGIDGAVAMSEGFVEGSVSRMIVTMCQEGILGEALKEASPGVVAALTFLVIDAVINGYALSKGEITADDYGNLMADHIMTSLIASPTTAIMLALLPGTKVAVIVGCMAGGMIAAIGYAAGKEVVMEMVDGGGFEAVIPEEAVTTIGVAKEKIAGIDLKDNLSALKDTMVSTVSGGYIKVKSMTIKE